MVRGKGCGELAAGGELTYSAAVEMTLVVGGDATEICGGAGWEDALPVDGGGGGEMAEVEVGRTGVGEVVEFAADCDG